MTFPLTEIDQELEAIPKSKWRSLFHNTAIGIIGLNAGMTNVAVGAALGRGNGWNNFTQGFGNGAVASLGKQWYQSVVGYRPRMESGEGVFEGSQAQQVPENMDTTTKDSVYLVIP